MTTRPQGTPDWLVERLALGELDAAAAADVRRRLAAEGRDADAELAALATSNREILEAHPPARIAAAVRARAATRSPARWLPLASLALAGVAAVVLIARPLPPGKGTTTGAELTPETTTIKGATALHVYRRVADRSELLHNGARASRGDLLQLTYVAADERAASDYGAVLSIDGGGHVTVHLPEGNAATAARLSPKGEVRLPSAYELDDAPAFERFILVTGQSPFSLAPVLDAARALAAKPQTAREQALALPQPLHQMSVTLDKSRKETP